MLKIIIRKHQTASNIVYVQKWNRLLKLKLQICPIITTRSGEGHLNIYRNDINLHIDNTNV